MSMDNFYSSATQEWIKHEGASKAHYNWGNQLVHSSLYKKLNPLRQNYEYSSTGEITQMPMYFGGVPQLSWVYGNLDYSFNKYHRHYQAHDDWLPDRKGKTLGHKNGGFCNPNMQNSKYMVLKPNFIPKGCYREIRKYNACATAAGKEACMNEKISIMEVCPDHVLEGLREKRKWFLRAEAIDNQTYKRAMGVSEYNKGRSVSDLEIKDWSYGHAKNLRSDSTWQDDRYDPIKYPHAHRYDNVNFPEQEYKDVFGGTLDNALMAEYEDHKIQLFKGESTAMINHQADARKASLRASKDEIDGLNKKEE